MADKVKFIAQCVQLTNAAADVGFVVWRIFVASHVFSGLLRCEIHCLEGGCGSEQTGVGLVWSSCCQSAFYLEPLQKQFICLQCGSGLIFGTFSLFQLVSNVPWPLKVPIEFCQLLLQFKCDSYQCSQLVIVFLMAGLWFSSSRLQVLASFAKQHKGFLKLIFILFV